MKLYDIAVRRPVTTVMVIMAFVFFGIVSYMQTSVDLLPAVNMPMAVVFTTYQAGPQEVESIVTTSMETAVTQVPGVKKITSQSSENSSLVLVEFEDSVDMDATLFKLGQYTSAVMDMLPDGTQTPIIISINPNMIPAVEVAASHDSMQGANFRRYIESNIMPNLESIEGVASVSVTGGVQNEVRITLSQEKLQQYNFALNSIVQQLQADNVSVPGGRTSKGDIELNIKVDGKYKTVADIENIMLVGQPDQSAALTAAMTGAQANTTPTMVRLGDVARVELTNKHSATIFRSNGEESMSLSFSKESTANIIDTAKNITQRIQTLQKENPGLRLTVISDQSTFISDSVNNVLQSALLGMVLAVLVLLFFLRDIKTSLIVGIAMPICIIATFTFLYLFKITINLLSLGGLTFAVGMLVDNSIIVLENIYRHIEMGEDRKTAAIKGTQEITMAIFASTLTNIAIFLPIIYIGGMIGTWLRDLAVTITVAMLMSFLVAVMVIPMFASIVIRKSDKATILDGGKEHKWYRGSLDFALHKRALSVILAVVVSIASIGIGLTSGLELMPSMGSNEYQFTISMENGLKNEVKTEYISALESEIKKIDYIENTYVSMGGGMFSMRGGAGDSVTLTIATKAKPGKQAEEIIGEIEQLANSLIPNKEVSGSNTGGMMMAGFTGAGVSFQLQGNDMQELRSLAEEMKTKLEQEGYVKKVEHSYEEGLPYLSLELNKSKAASYGLTTYQVASALDTAQNGKVATRYSIEGTEIDVRVQTNTQSKNSVEDLKNMLIPTPAGQVVALGTIATLSEKTSPATIIKENKIKVVNFTVDLNKDITPGEAQPKIEKALADMDLPSGYNTDFTGATQEMSEAVSQLALAIIFGVLLIYMILAAQFESFKQPLIIMISIPFSFTGGMIMLGITRMPISVPVLMGMLMLVGIIVNNAILIVDTFNQFRQNEGMDIVTAIREGCRIRLRPMLLTTLTTILGLVPMAIGIGQGTKMMQPLAVFVVGGLAVGTILTMVLVPVFYLITDKERKSEVAVAKLAERD